MSKVFTDESTDGTWNQNIGLDTIASQSLGILIPNSRLTFAQGTYSAGNMAWRIQSSSSLQVKSRGLGNVAGLSCYESDQIAPVMVAPNDIISFYPLAEPAVNQTNTLAWIQTSKGTELFEVTGTVSGTDGELKSSVQNQTLGDAFFGSMLQRIWVQVSDTDGNNSISVVDEMGGVVYTAYGGKRGATLGSKSGQYNLYLLNIGIPIGKGWSIKVNNTASV
jgi:hypothetical protein